MKQFFGRKSRSTLTLVILVSFALHIVAVIIFGAVKFVSEALREEKVFEAAPIAPPPQKEPEYTVNIQQRTRSTPPPRPPAIVVNNPADLDIPELDIEVDVESSSVYGRGGGGFGGGLSGMREMSVDNLAVDLGLFGSQKAISNALEGGLYDLKQTADGDPVPEMGRSAYFDIIDKFQSSWNEGVLEDYYKADVRLYTRQIFIPLTQAKRAPEAFGAEKEIKPIYWVAHYRGNWIAPFTGTMRFAGQGDNILVVRLNRRVVLDATLGGALERNKNVKSEPIGKTADPYDRPMVAGKWFSVVRGESYPMEVLLGEYGGLFSSYLLAQVKGQDYELQSDGENPRLPVFQMGPAKLPPYKEGKDSPEISDKPFLGYFRK